MDLIIVYLWHRGPCPFRNIVECIIWKNKRISANLLVPVVRCLREMLPQLCTLVRKYYEEKKKKINMHMENEYRCASNYRNSSRYATNKINAMSYWCYDNILKSRHFHLIFSTRKACSYIYFFVCESFLSFRFASDKILLYVFKFLCFTNTISLKKFRLFEENNTSKMY